MRVVRERTMNANANFHHREKRSLSHGLEGIRAIKIDRERIMNGKYNNFAVLRAFASLR